MRNNTSCFFQNYRIFHFEMEDCWIEIMDFCQLLLRRWEGWLPPRLDVARFKVVRYFPQQDNVKFEEHNLLDFYCNKIIPIELGCGRGDVLGPHPSNTLTTMLSHPGSVDVLDGTSPTITGLGYEAQLMQHNVSNNTLSPFTVSKPNSKQLISQNSYQGTPTGYTHSRNASMTASMEVIYINEAQNISVCFFNYC